jgi:hypothetical protein
VSDIHASLRLRVRSGKYEAKTNQHVIRHCQNAHGVARKAEASRGALQRAIASCDSNPLVDMRTGARHEDGRLGGLGTEHCLEGITTAETVMVFVPT